jgi:DNA processing protein
MVMFSIIYSKVEKKNGFLSAKIHHDILYRLFFHSNYKNENIFNLTKEELKKIILESAHILKQENSRIKVEERVKNIMSYFFDETQGKNLEILKERAKKELRICKEKKIKYIDYFSRKYPNSLKKLRYPPFVIFYKGYFPKDIELERALAVIGTRNPDEKYGVEVAKRVGKLLGENKWWNISGLALGCDECGHKGSLSVKGKTGAILGQGLATEIYPPKNKILSEKILENNGFLMSELPPTVEKEQLYFIWRNRLQSGLSKGIFVVQTSKKGGTLHTVKYSLEQDKKTIIWDPSNIEEVYYKSCMHGNRILLGLTEENLSVKISQKNYKKIIGIKNSKELLKILNKEH